jgi:hypothetical protein
MRKEVLIAIIIGFGLGLVITFGIWTANKALKSAPPETPTEPEIVEETPSPVPEIELIITSPEDNTISETEMIEITGQTSANAIVTIVYPDGEKILEADEKGNFTSEISLIGGDNLIEVSAFNQQGDQSKKSITVVYSTAELD